MSLISPSSPSPSLRKTSGNSTFCMYFPEHAVLLDWFTCFRVFSLGCPACLLMSGMTHFGFENHSAHLLWKPSCISKKYNWRHLTLHFLFRCFIHTSQTSLVTLLLVASWSSFRAELGGFWMILNQEICFKFAIFCTYWLSSWEQTGANL